MHMVQVTKNVLAMANDILRNLNHVHYATVLVHEPI